MKQTTATHSRVKKLKLLLVMPLMTLPFLTLGFWAMGGGKTTGSEKPFSGLDLQLPAAQLKADGGNKLSFYERAALEEKKRQEAELHDPYFQDSSSTGLFMDSVVGQEGSFGRRPYGGSGRNSFHSNHSNIPKVHDEPPENKLLLKLRELNQHINSMPHLDSHEKDNKQDVSGSHIEKDPQFSESVDRLELMMGNLKEGNREDTEMQKLHNVLESILDIEHPERITDSSKTILKHGTLTPLVSTHEGGDNDTGFYGLSNTQGDPANTNLITVTVQGTQTLVDRAVVKLRLLQDIDLGNTTIPHETLLAGLVHFQAERLQIEIPSIRYGAAIFPVKMEVYDLDGLPGLNIPGSLARDVAKSSGTDILQRWDISSADPSLKIQAASAGIGAAKSFLSKKIKQIQVTIPDGYQFFLKQKQ